MTQYEPDYESLCLKPEDVARVAEFFDCDVNAAFEFVRSVWLPDAKVTALRIMRAVRAGDWVSLVFLCDHLREGARSVGAERIAACAVELQKFVAARQIRDSVLKALEVHKSLKVLGQILTDCA